MVGTVSMVETPVKHWATWKTLYLISLTCWLHFIQFHSLCCYDHKWRSWQKWTFYHIRAGVWSLCETPNVLNVFPHQFVFVSPQIVRISKKRFSIQNFSVRPSHHRTTNKQINPSIYLYFKYVYGIILDFLAMTPVDLRILMAACKQEHTSNRAESDQNFKHSKALSIWDLAHFWNKIRAG